MDKIQLGEFIKSIDQDLEIKEGKQFTEVTVPSVKIIFTGQTTQRKRRNTV